MTTERLLTASEIAGILGFHANTVKRIPARELPYFCLSKRGDRRYHPIDVQEFIDRRTVT